MFRIFFCESSNNYCPRCRTNNYLNNINLCHFKNMHNYLVCSVSIMFEFKNEMLSLLPRNDKIPEDFQNASNTMR